MDNEGGQPLGDPAAEGAGVAGDENVDQYFDDGGETFLPADHVSSLKVDCSQSKTWSWEQLDLKRLVELEM